MDKQRAHQLYELADRLSKVDVNSLSEEQKQLHSTMIAKLQEEAHGVAEDVNGEYDDEAGMAQSNLHTMARAVNGLLDTIKDNDNLPEWAQEKIAKAEMMVTSVWDYLLSQKEQGMDPKVEESKKPSPKLTPVDLKKTDPVSEEINKEAYERLQKVFAFKNYES